MRFVHLGCVVILLLALALPVRAQHGCDDYPEYRPKAEQQRIFNAWMRMLDGLGPDAITRRESVDADLADEEAFLSLHRQAGAADPEACLLGLGFSRGFLWTGHALYAAGGSRESLRWMEQVAARPSSRLPASALLLLTGELDPARFVRDLGTWPKAAERTMGLRLMEGLPPAPALVPVLDPLLRDPDPEVRLAALALLDRSGSPDFVTELEVIRKCPQCEPLPPAGRGPWSLLANQWDSLSSASRAKAIEWTRWTIEGRAWLDAVLPTLAPDSAAALFDALARVDPKDARWPVQALRMAWLRALAGTSSRVVEEAASTRMTLRQILASLDPGDKEQQSLLRKLARQPDAVVAITAALRLGEGGDTAEPTATIVRHFGDGILPRWLVVDLGRKAPAGLAPLYLHTAVAGDPATACLAMRYGGALVASRQHGAFGTLLEHSIEQMLALPDHPAGGWGAILRGVHDEHADGPMSPDAAVVCRVRFGIGSWRGLQGDVPDGWLEAALERRDRAALLVRGWSMAASGDPALVGITSVLKRSGDPALAEEAYQLGWMELGTEAFFRSENVSPGG